WHQRFAREMAGIAAGQCGSWSLPVTASAEERLLSQTDAGQRHSRGVAAVVADGREMAEWLVATCRAHGWTTVWNSDWRSAELQGADVVVWDVGPIEPAAFDILQEIRDVFGDAPVVALTDFPRVEGQQQLTAAGAAAVLSKPLLVTDLAWQLDRLAGRHFTRA
ncbi:MAG TPA: response regulator, partial [Pirellulales bacterium]|nr:response regulator [Pirellulales bacterium]